jgi:HEAT repeat protein
VRGLTAALKDADGSVRTQAALALWNIDQDAERALAVLNQVLKDLDVKDRWEAIDAFGQISVEVRPAIRGMTEVLVNGLKDRDPRVRIYSARWLFRRTRQARLVTPLLRDGVSDRDSLVRLATVESLGELGAEGKIVELMSTALQDRDVSVRLAAEEGLARGGAEMVPQLIGALKDKSPRVRAGVARALGMIGPPAKSALEVLLPLSKDPDAGVREAAREAQGRIAPGREQTLTPPPAPSRAPPR